MNLRHVIALLVVRGEMARARHFGRCLLERGLLSGRRQSGGVLALVRLGLLQLLGDRARLRLRLRAASCSVLLSALTHFPVRAQKELGAEGAGLLQEAERNGAAAR